MLGNFSYYNPTKLYFGDELRPGGGHPERGWQALRYSKKACKLLT